MGTFTDLFFTSDKSIAYDCFVKIVGLQFMKVVLEKGQSEYVFGGNHYKAKITKF